MPANPAYTLVDHISMTRGATDNRRQTYVPVISVRELPADLLISNTPPAYSRSKPKIFGPVAEALMDQRRWFESLSSIQAPPSEVYRLEKVLINGGVILTDNFCVVKESLINRQFDQEFCGLRRIGADQFMLDEGYYDRHDLVLKSAVLLQQNWDENYGHWLIEGLPRLASVLASTDVSASVFIVTNTAPVMMQIYIDSLSMFGISKKQLCFVEDKSILQVETLIYPPPITEQPWVKSPVVVDVLNDVAQRTNSLYAKFSAEIENKKLFINRPTASRRRLRNREEIRAIAAERGFSEVNPGGLSLFDQIRSFKYASHVIGVLGAECTNFVFAPDGVRFMGLAPNLMQDDFYWDLASLKNGAYYSVHGLSSDLAAGMNSDFTIEAATFYEALDEFDPT